MTDLCALHIVAILQRTPHFRLGIRSAPLCLMVAVILKIQRNLAVKRMCRSVIHIGDHMNDPLFGISASF
jgi:hypothetical protein